MVSTGWKGPFVDAELNRILLSGSAKRTADELSTLMASEAAALEEKSSSTSEKEGEEKTTETQGAESSTDSTQNPSTQPTTPEAAEVSSKSEESEETTPTQPTSSPTKGEKLKRKKTWKKGQALRAIVTKTKKGSGRKKKGLSKEQKVAAKEYKRQARAEGSKPKPFGRGIVSHTACRSMSILPEHTDSTLMVHNGKDFDRVTITDTMVGHKLGEFAITRRTRHNLNRKKSKLTIRKKDSGESTGYGTVSLSRMSNWSMDSTE